MIRPKSEGGQDEHGCLFGRQFHGPRHQGSIRIDNGRLQRDNLIKFPSKIKSRHNSHCQGQL